MTTEITTPPEAKPSKLIVQDNSTISYLMDTGKFEHCYRIAKLMATASLIPDHLKFTGNASNKRELTPEEKIGNCFMIVNQAIRWGIDPFSMAPETYVVGGKLAFQGKLVAAIVNGLANLEERLSYTFSGPLGSDDFTITVSGKIRGESEARTVSVRVGSVKTDNQMWKKDPEQKLVYTGATKWARRHCPEVILGIIVDDEIESEAMRDVTPRDTANVKVITGGTAAPEADKKAPRGKASQKTTEEPTAAKDMPSRDEIKAIIRKRMKENKIDLPVAETRCREAGLLKPGQTFTGASDAELHTISQRLEVLDAPEAATEPSSHLRACYENHQVTHAPEGVERKWTCWRLRYSVSGDETIREAVTFSSTIGDTLDKLEGGEAILLTLKSTEKGDQIVTLELAPKEGGAA
jgi:hypothetical protein